MDVDVPISVSMPPSDANEMGINSFEGEVFVLRAMLTAIGIIIATTGVLLMRPAVPPESPMSAPYYL